MIFWDITSRKREVLDISFKRINLIKKSMGQKEKKKKEPVILIKFG